MKNVLLYKLHSEKYGKKGMVQEYQSSCGGLFAKRFCWLMRNGLNANRMISYPKILNFVQELNAYRMINCLKILNFVDRADTSELEDIEDVDIRVFFFFFVMDL